MKCQCIASHNRINQSVSIEYLSPQANYILDLGTAKKASIHNLKIGGDVMDSKQMNTTNGKLTIEVSETPVFVEGIN